MLGLHKHILDFEILETGNTKTLVFVDSSQYMEAPDRPLLEVTMPGFKNYFLVNVNANNVNVFNSSNLGFNTVLSETCFVDLPDGIWEYKYKICPYKYIYIIKKKMRVTTLLKKLEELYNKIDLSECEGKEDKDQERLLSHIHILIEGAKAAVDKDAKKAQSYYKLADKLITKQLDRLCKKCK